MIAAARDQADLRGSHARGSYGAPWKLRPAPIDLAPNARSHSTYLLRKALWTFHLHLLSTHSLIQTVSTCSPFVALSIHATGLSSSAEAMLFNRRRRPVAQSVPENATIHSRPLCRSQSLPHLFAVLDSQVPSHATEVDHIRITPSASNPLNISGRLLDGLQNDKIVRNTARSRYDGTNDVECGSFDANTANSESSGVQDATPWDTDLESGGTTVGLEAVPKPVVEVVPKASLWLGMRQRARNDPLSVAGILAGVIVLPFVIRGSTR